MNDSPPKLNHSEFADKLNTHFIQGHYDSGVAFGFVEGVLATLQSIGFDQDDSYLIIFEHLRPDFILDQPYNRSPLIHLHGIRETWECVRDARANKSTNEQFPPNLDRFKDFYSNTDHSRQFWGKFETDWLPKYSRTQDAIQKERNKPKWQRFLERL